MWFIVKCVSYFGHLVYLTLSSLGIFEHSQPGGGGDSALPPTVTFLLVMQIK